MTRFTRPTLYVLSFLLISSVIASMQIDDNRDAATQVDGKHAVAMQISDKRAEIPKNLSLNRGVKAVGGAVDLTGTGKAQVTLVVVLDEGWDTFGFHPSEGIEIANRVRFFLPDGVELLGNLSVTSRATTDDKYGVFGNLTPRYSGVIEIRQDLSVDESIIDFSGMTVTGRLYCQVNRLTPPWSLATRTPFVLFFRNPLGVRGVVATPSAPKPTQGVEGDEVR
ncbi:MAG: hypothetical protein R3C19_27030 [Planctomycetaceae bacterium]